MIEGARIYDAAAYHAAFVWLAVSAAGAVASFATFCGPPLKVFELEMLFDPLESRIRERGATVVDRLAVSSNSTRIFSSARWKACSVSSAARSSSGRSSILRWTARSERPGCSDSATPFVQIESNANDQIIERVRLAIRVRPLSPV